MIGGHSSLVRLYFGAGLVLTQVYSGQMSSSLARSLTIVGGRCKCWRFLAENNRMNLDGYDQLY